MPRTLTSRCVTRESIPEIWLVGLSRVRGALGGSSPTTAPTNGCPYARSFWSFPLAAPVSHGIGGDRPCRLYVDVAREYVARSTLPRQPLNSTLVVALRRDASSRRSWEDQFVASLKADGINATASYTVFPDAPPDTMALSAAVRGKGYDAVLVTHPLGAVTEPRYVPGYLSTEPVTYMSPWTGHYYTAYSQVYSPGYLETDRVVRYETEVWMVRGGGRLVWSGTTESINPASAADMNKEIADVIVPALAKSG